MGSMMERVRLAMRQLMRAPGFTLTVIATLGIGIGLNAAIFTVVDCVLLRPLGYHDADRIVALRTHFVDENRSIAVLGGDDYNDVAREVKGLEATAYYQSGSDGLRVNGETLYVPVAYASPGFTTVIGVEAAAGRIFQPDDRNADDALVSSGFARDHFGSAQAALGQAIEYEGRLRPIVGVLAEGFSFPGKTAVWLEEKPQPATSNRTAYNQHAIGKRRPGVSEAELAAEMAGFSRRLQSAYVEDKLKTIETVSLQEQLVGKIRPTLHLLMGSVAVILLIVCVNVTHLQLVRATRRMRSVTICTALGASRSTLALGALAEALLLAVGGCASALLLAVPTLKVLERMAPANIPRLAEVGLNVDVLLFSSLLSTLLVGATAVLPVWRSWHLDPADTLRQDSARGTEGRGTARLRNGFVVVEVALTLVLCVVAVLLTRKLIEQSRQELGFDAESLVTLDIHAIAATASTSESRSTSAKPAPTAAEEAARDRGKLARLDDTLAALRSTPGVDSVAGIRGAPMGFFGSDVGYAVKGRQVFAAPFKGLPNAEIRPVTPTLFTTMHIPLLHGRFLSADDRSGTPMVLLINQELARTVFPGQDPVGQQIMCGFSDELEWWTIVGVVGNIRDDSPATLPTPTFYVPVAQHAGLAGDMQVVVRTHLPPTAMLDTLTKRLKETHPEIAVKATTMRQNIGETERAEQFRTLLFGSFAGVSILLAAIGLYGVTAYSVAQRRFEFGLRVALGANQLQVLGMVLRKGLGFAALGLVFGVALSLGLVRVLGSVVGKLPAFDLPSYALASAAVFVIAFVATLLPARAAAKVDPMDVLRSE